VKDYAIIIRRGFYDQLGDKKLNLKLGRGLEIECL